MPIRPLSKELQEVAVKELNEVPSRVQADIDHLREWISQQPHLNARTDDQWLLTFLRGTKYSLQRAKQKLDSFYTVRKLVPEFHANRDPFLPEIQEVLRRGIILVLPKTAYATAPRIIIWRFYNLDPEKIKTLVAFKVLLMIMDILMLEDDEVVIAGQCFITDFNNLSYSCISQLTPDFAKKILMYIQDVYPSRVKELNYFNAPSPVIAIYNMLKPIIPQKLKSRIFIHTEDNVSISKAVSTSILPKEYGGEEVSCDELAEYWKAKVESYRDWFLEDAQYGTDESKRPGKPATVESPFGAEGSFIRLEID